MWRLTIIANTLMMLLFWLISNLALLPAYNRFYQYRDGAMVLPAFTWSLIRFRFWAVVIPVCWLIASVVVWQKVKDKESNRRNEVLLSFSTITCCAGLVLWGFYLLAGMLPYLYFNAPVE